MFVVFQAYVLLCPSQVMDTVGPAIVAECAKMYPELVVSNLLICISSKLHMFNLQLHCISSYYANMFFKEKEIQILKNSFYHWTFYG